MSVVDRKGFHELCCCGGCGLLYRYPYETSKEMGRFYQRAYSQTGLTTDLPDEATLQALLTAGFRGSQKDFSRILELLTVLSVPRGSKILDFGANWGYTIWQFRQAGLAAVGYELSKPRADYSKNLGVNVFTDWADIKSQAPFDVVFSSHALEHTPDPAQAIRRQLEVLSPGGWLVALFPNGSDVFRESDPGAFHLAWGRVHPVFLNEHFMRKLLPESGLAIGAICPEDLGRLRQWDGITSWTGTLNTVEMLAVYCKRNKDVVSTKAS